MGPGLPGPTSYKSGDIAPFFFLGGEIFFTPVKPGKFFLAIFCRGFFNGSIFQRSVRDLAKVPFTRISRWVPSKLHDSPFSISFSEVRFSLMDQKNPIELVDTFDTVGTSYWYIIYYYIHYYYIYYYYYYYRYKYKCRWWFYTAFSTILYPYPGYRGIHDPNCRNGNPDPRLTRLDEEYLEFLRRSHQANGVRRYKEMRYSRGVWLCMATCKIL